VPFASSHDDPKHQPTKRRNSSRKNASIASHRITQDGKAVDPFYPELNLKVLKENWNKNYVRVYNSRSVIYFLINNIIE
jgi:hypothetical protein